MIFETFGEEVEQVPVPVTPDRSGNTLQKQCDVLDKLHRASMLIEEVFAVRTSLDIAPREGLIRNDDEQLGKIIESYKEAYKKYIPDFPNYFVVFNSVAHLIGMDAAAAMIHSVFATNNPHVAFYDIIAKVFKGYPSDEQAYFLASLFFNDAYSYFFQALYDLDNGERHQIKIIHDGAVKVLQSQQATVKKLKDAGIEVIYGSKHSFLHTHYAKYIGQIYEVDLTKPPTEDVKGERLNALRDGNFLILLEAIRQQLTQGKGLLCPYWMKYKPPLCCGGQTRELLEKVWKGTEKSSSKRWKRRGCLAEKGCPYRIRVY